MEQAYGQVRKKALSAKVIGQRVRDIDGSQVQRCYPSHLQQEVVKESENNEAKSESISNIFTTKYDQKLLVLNTQFSTIL